MGSELINGEVDRRIGRVAGRQYGVITRAQLHSLGASKHQIQRRIAAGRLHRVHTGVFAVGHRAPRREARWLAAVLACGEGGVLSHRSAAVLWGLADREGLPDVTTRTCRRSPGVANHRAELVDAERTVRNGIPVTSPARTLVDLAHAVEAEQLTRAVRQAQFDQLFDVPSVRRALDRRPSSALRRLVDDIAPTQSILEDRLLAICSRHRIPRPLTQQPLAGRRVDFLWPAERLVVETDGWQGHATQDAFQADRTTSNELQLAGYVVLRFTRADLERRPRRVATAIRDALRRA
jgi:very-short-patch-repair endonuclease